MGSQRGDVGRSIWSEHQRCSLFTTHPHCQSYFVTSNASQKAGEPLGQRGEKSESSSPPLCLHIERLNTCLSTSIW